jgi:hypothetical protein
MDGRSATTRGGGTLGEVGETPWTPKASTSRLCRSTWENGRQIAPMRIHHLPSLIHGVVPARAVLFRERLSDSRAPPVRKVPQPPTVRRGLRGPDRSVRYIAPPLFDIRVPQAMARFPPGTRSYSREQHSGRDGRHKLLLPSLGLFHANRRCPIRLPSLPSFIVLPRLRVPNSLNLPSMMTPSSTKA